MKTVVFLPLPRSKRADSSTPPLNRPNFLVILIDDLRYDEFGAGGHPYMKTPNIDRLAHEGTLFERAFHTTPICSPNRASIMTGQYASRHGIIDNVARDAMSHRLPNYHLALQNLGYETAHIGKWHMGNDGKPRPGYDYWVSYDGHGRLNDPRLNHDGEYREHRGYITDIMNRLAVEWLERPHDKPWSLFFAHKAVHPDAEQAADGTFRVPATGAVYVVADRHKDLYRDAIFPRKPNMLPPAEVAKSKPAWAECLALKSMANAQAILRALHSGDQEEIRLRARMMAAVDEGVGQILDVLERNGELDDTFIVFLGDNGYFFGEHALGPERRFAYEEGIRSPFVVRYPKKANAGTRRRELVICQDLAPTLLTLAGGEAGPHIQGRSLLPLLAQRGRRAPAGWRKSILCEYWAEQALPWLVGMTYKAVRTDRYKLIHWVNRGTAGELDELYDLDDDPYEVRNLIRSRTTAPVRDKLRKELRNLVAEAIAL
ncbi:MAG TPA: sulfatase-like hydrolase/transferase [Casimicrobiaceae bacterium]|nr:sulfatase-like hydrolase/transferase [Casimicrobiaceae bacterium]